MLDYDNTLKWMTILGIGIPILIVCLVLYLVIFRLDKLEYFGSRVYKLLRFLGTRFKKKYIAKDFRARILEASKSITSEIPEIMPYDLSIKWVDKIDRESFLHEGKVIIRLSDTEDRTQGMVMALQQYVEKGFIPRARKNVHPAVLKSLDKYVVRKLLGVCFKQGVDYYDEKIITPLQQLNTEDWGILQEIEAIDMSGLLVQVLIREILDKSLKIDSMPDPSLMAETKEFLRYLHNIITREHGDEVDLSFIGVHFKVAVVIVGKFWTMVKSSSSYYKSAVRRLKEGIETIYILSDSEMKSSFADEIAQEIKNRNIEIQRKSTYKYKRRHSKGTFSGTCIALYTCEASYPLNMSTN